MKIIYVENVRMPSERAHAYQIVQQCAWMGRLGHDVTLVNPDRAGGRDVFSFFGLSDRPFVHVFLWTADWLERSPAWLKPLAYVVQRATFIRSLRAWMKTQQADVWYTRDPAIADVILAATSDRVFLELHDEPRTNATRFDRIRDAVAGFIVISHGLKDRLLELGVSEGRIHVAPDGYDPKAFEHLNDRDAARKALSIPPDAFVVFYGGSLYPWKGLDPIVQRWAKTDAKAWLVLIGGPDPDRERLQKLVSPDVKDRIRILPRRSHEKLVSFYPAADVGLIASSSEHEVAARYTSPIKLFEYLAAGLPILASDVPSSHEVLDERVATFFRPADVTQVLGEMMRDSAWLRSAAGEARTFVKPYTWQARAEGIVTFMSGCVVRRS